MTEKIDDRAGIAARIRRWWCHAIWWHTKESVRSVRSLLVDLPGFLRDEHGHRWFQPPSEPHVLWGRKQWTSRYRINAPTLHVTVQDGMGEHYGYPRHSCYVILWWGRRGYAFGVYFSKPDSNWRT